MARPLSTVGAAEEARCEVIATVHELLVHDRQELTLYDRLDMELDRRDYVAAKELLATIRRRDIAENSKHRHIGAVLLEAAS